MRWNENAVFAAICWGLLIAILLSVSGCALLRSTRVEARADYSVFANDFDVSIVAVGYVKE